MKYNKTTWIDDDTPLSAKNLNNIEEGIENIYAATINGKKVSEDPQLTAKDVGALPVFANALKGNASGKKVTIDGVNPIYPELKVKLTSEREIVNYLDMTKISDQTFNGNTLTNNNDGTLTIILRTDLPVMSLNETLQELCPTAQGSEYSTIYFEVEEPEYKGGNIVLQCGPVSTYEGEEATSSLQNGEYFSAVSPVFTLFGSYTKPITIKNLRIGTKTGTPLITDFSNVEVIRSGKNLIPLPYSGGDNTTNNGVTFKTNDNGEIELSGTSIEGSSSGATFYVWGNGSNLLNLKLEQDAILSGCPVGGTSTSYRLMALIEYPDGSVGYPQDYGSGVKLSAGITIKYIYISIKSGTNVNGIIFKPQLEYGVSKTAYEPYIEPLTVFAEEGGIVKGLIGLLSTNVISTNSSEVFIDVEYSRDLNKAFAKLENAILNNV